jgi:hypothetical protein
MRCPVGSKASSERDGCALSPGEGEADSIFGAVQVVSARQMHDACANRRTAIELKKWAELETWVDIAITSAPARIAAAGL